MEENFKSNLEMEIDYELMNIIDKNKIMLMFIINISGLKDGD